MHGLILAAGRSSRLPAYKMAQKINGKEVLIHCIEGMLPYVDHIVVVTGHNHKIIEALVSSYTRVETIHNPNYIQGMYSSIKQGLKGIKDDFFLIPGDICMVSPKTYELLSKMDGDVVVPSYQYRSGHPIKIKKQLIPSIIESSHEHLRAFLKNYEKIYVNVDDQMIHFDIDTMEDLEKLRGLKR